MTTPNHIAGGIVFTGLFCSLWSINIVENPLFISTTVIGSLLPDIDTTKSTIGKMVYPLAKYLNKTYGHRSITHSLVFLLFITILSLLTVKLFNLSQNIPYILFFSVLSHLILDMVTIFGIPFFYPFIKNPCVIPGNEKYRIRVADRKAEGIAFFIFAFLGLFMQPLFVNGFWTTYNKTIGDIEHINREANKNQNLLKIKYNYNEFNVKKRGLAFLVYHESKKIHLLDSSFHEIEKDQPNTKINDLEIIPTKIKNYTKTIKIDHKNLEEVNFLIKNKYIYTLDINTNAKTTLRFNNKTKNHFIFNEKNIYNPNFTLYKNDTLTRKNKESIEDKRRALEIAIKVEEDAIERANAPYFQAQNEITTLESLIKSTSNHYLINEYKTKIIKLKSSIMNFTPHTSKILPKLNDQLLTLLQQPSDELTEKDLRFFGNITLFHPTEK